MFKKHITELIFCAKSEKKGRFYALFLVYFGRIYLRHFWRTWNGRWNNTYSNLDYLFGHGPKTCAGNQFVEFFGYGNFLHLHTLSKWLYCHKKSLLDYFFRSCFFHFGISFDVIFAIQNLENDFWRFSLCFGSGGICKSIQKIVYKISFL